MVHCGWKVQVRTDLPTRVVQDLKSDSEQRMDLVPISPSEKMDVEGSGKDSISWSYDPSQRVQLTGAHGEEIVRDICIDNEVFVLPAPSLSNPLTISELNFAYTCGEDGMVRAWKLGDPSSDDQKPGNAMKSKKDKRGKESRYKPY